MKKTGTFEHFERTGASAPELVEFRREVRPMIEKLIAELSSLDGQVVVRAAAGLQELGTEAQAAVPALRSCFSAPMTDMRSRLAVLWAIYYVTPPEDPVGESLLDGWRIISQTHSEDFDRWSKTIEGDADQARIRQHAAFAAQALCETDRALSELPSAVALTAKEFPLRIRLTAIATLENLRHDAEDAGPALWELVRSDDHELIRRFAANALCAIEDDRIDLDLLMTALQLPLEDQIAWRERSEARQRDAEAYLDFLRRIDGSFQRQSAIEAVKQCANGHDLRAQIIHVGEIGPAAEDAVPALIRATRHKTPQTRRRAFQALQKIDPQAIPPL